MEESHEIRKKYGEAHDGGEYLLNVRMAFCVSGFGSGIVVRARVREWTGYGRDTGKNAGNTYLIVR